MKWEYRVYPLWLGDMEEAQHGMNALGGEGWEIVAVIPKAAQNDKADVVIYKRPLTDPHSN